VKSAYHENDELNSSNIGNSNIQVRWLNDDFMAEGFEIRALLVRNESMFTPVNKPPEKLPKSRGIIALF
jgi:hypothetical protein